MRLLLVAAISLMLGPGAFAQQPPKASAPKGQTQQDVETQHPEWFQEANKYEPCPAEVTLRGRTTCLGLGGE